MTEALASDRIRKTRRKQMRKPRLTEELLRKLERIDGGKDEDGWTRLISVFPVRNIPATLFDYHCDGGKIKLTEEGLTILRWCR